MLVPASGDPAAGALTTAEVVARDPSAARAPVTVVDGATSSVGIRVRGTEHGHAVSAPTDGAGAVLEPAPAAAPEETAGAEPVAPAVPKPAPLRWEAPAALAPAPKLDAYSLRLVSSRALYDSFAVSVSRTPHLAPLVRPTTLRVNPFELERLGVQSGGTVHLIGARGTLTLVAAADAGVPAGRPCSASTGRRPEPPISSTPPRR